MIGNDIMHFGENTTSKSFKNALEDFWKRAEHRKRGLNFLN